MRIWDLEPDLLCRNHLLGEHRELHAIWSILTNGKSGYARHPETLRWEGKLKALYLRHEALVTEMTNRKHNHANPLDEGLASGHSEQKEYVDSLSEQLNILRKKDCDCRV